MAWPQRTAASRAAWSAGPRDRRGQWQAGSPPFLRLPERVEDRHRDDRSLPGFPASGPLTRRDLLPLRPWLCLVGWLNGSGAGSDAPVPLAERGSWPVPVARSLAGAGEQILDSVGELGFGGAGHRLAGVVPGQFAERSGDAV